MRKTLLPTLAFLAVSGTAASAKPAKPRLSPMQKQMQKKAKQHQKQTRAAQKQRAQTRRAN